MQLKAFASFHKGHSHVKADADCEDYSISYNDPEKRFFIAALSDGHSDKNCFRSSVGARFACEVAKEVLTRFCESYIDEDMHFEDLNEKSNDSLKKSIKQGWDDKVEIHLAENPVTEEEIGTIKSEEVKALYRAGKAWEHIYGATFMATAICRDMCIILHIGDGVIMSISSDGKYITPIKYDPKSETGFPASICDSDLFLREYAFRCEFYKDIPQAVFLTSDGIGDSLSNVSIYEFIYTLLSMLEEKRDESDTECLNEKQQIYLDSCVSYYADKGNGVEDDCSIGGIYMEGIGIPEVTVPLDYAMEMYKSAVDEHNLQISDYERRKKESILEIERLEKLENDNSDKWIDAINKIEELKKILRVMVNNENNKKKVLESRISSCKVYVERAGGVVDPADLAAISPIDPKLLEDNPKYASLKDAQKNYNLKKEEADKVQEDLRNAANELQNAAKEYKEGVVRVKELENNSSEILVEQNDGDVTIIDESGNSETQITDENDLPVSSENYTEKAEDTGEHNEQKNMSEGEIKTPEGRKGRLGKIIHGGFGKKENND